MKYRKIIPVAILVLCFVLLNIACSSSNAASTAILGKVTEYRSTRAQPLVKNAPAPDFQFQMPDGSVLFLSDLQDSVVFLNFWAVSCPYCVVEMPYFQEAYDRLSAQGIIILGINTGESEKTVAKFITDKKLSFPIILDPEIYASILYGAQYLPTTYFIDKAGNIQGAKIGAFQNANEVITTIESLLQ